MFLSSYTLNVYLSLLNPNRNIPLNLAKEPNFPRTDNSKDTTHNYLQSSTTTDPTNGVDAADPIGAASKIRLDPLIGPPIRLNYISNTSYSEVYLCHRSSRRSRIVASREERKLGKDVSVLKE